MKLRRYHINIYVPEWGRNSVQEFCSKLADKELEYSFHATQKLKRMSKKYRLAVHNLIKSINISDDILLDYVFEFYTDEDKEVKKVCFRFPMVNLDTDIIVVISSTARIVTVYLNNEFDKHRSLELSLYERKEETEMRAKLILRVKDSDEEEKHFEPDGYLELIMNINGREYLLSPETVGLDNNDKDGYLSKLENIIVNDAAILTNALGLKLHVDDSVYEFLDYDEEEIKKFVDRLLIEI
jgi:hypothetical protein